MEDQVDVSTVLEYYVQTISTLIQNAALDQGRIATLRKVNEELKKRLEEENEPKTSE